ncbi:MAG: rhamnulokinase, partial [Actinomycetales bacterium]|nr:rhamnulokinase [Actinomycetales bacterium]
MSRYVAIDLGASSGRVVVGELVDGVMRTEEVARFANRPVYAEPLVPGGPPEMRWDLDALWRGIAGGLAAAARGGPVASVGVDTWAVDYGLLGSDGGLLADPVHYRDPRTEGVPERFFAAMDPDVHYAVTGAQVQPFNTVFQLLAEAGTDRFASAEQLLLIPDLLSHRLGAAPYAEVTNASTTGLLDVRSRAWSPEVLGVAGPLAGRDLAPLLGDLVEPGTVVGEVDASALGAAVVGEEAPGGSGAVLAGLAGAKIVAVGSHDTASAVAAVPMADPKVSAYISSGTWSLVGLELDAPVLSEASRAANHTNELGVAGTVRYLKNVAGMWLLSESQRVWRAAGLRAELSDLLHAASRAEPRRTVIDVDHPCFLPPGAMPARVADLARASGQPVPRDPGEVTRAILDSLAEAYRRAVLGLA